MNVVCILFLIEMNLFIHRFVEDIIYFMMLWILRVCAMNFIHDSSHRAHTHIAHTHAFASVSSFSISVWPAMLSSLHTNKHTHKVKLWIGALIRVRMKETKWATKMCICISLMHNRFYSSYIHNAQTIVV